MTTDRDGDRAVSAGQEGEGKTALRFICNWDYPSPVQSGPVQSSPIQSIWSAGSFQLLLEASGLCFPALR